MIPSTQCTATSKRSGERCRRMAIRGGTVCPMHGGSAPAVKESARQRIFEATVPMIKVLTDIAENEAMPPRDRVPVNRLPFDCLVPDLLALEDVTCLFNSAPKASSSPNSQLAQPSSPTRVNCLASPTA